MEVGVQLGGRPGDGGDEERPVEGEHKRLEVEWQETPVAQGGRAL